MEQQIISACTDALVPILEMSLILAGDYVKACGRSCITAKDQEYALKYCAMYKVGERMGSMFPEIYEDSSDSDEDDIELVDESEEENKFVRYSGLDGRFLAINQAYDEWEHWEPKSPVEEALKNTIDNI